MIDWRIYYDDGSTFDNEMGRPQDAPVLGVILVWQRTDNDPHNIGEKHTGVDWYWWRSDLNAWLSGDIYGYLDQAMNLGACWPKQGRVVSNTEYASSLNRANRDPDFWHDPNSDS